MLFLYPSSNSGSMRRAQHHDALSATKNVVSFADSQYITSDKNPQGTRVAVLYNPLQRCRSEHLAGLDQECFVGKSAHKLGKYELGRLGVVVVWASDCADMKYIQICRGVDEGACAIAKKVFYR